MARTRKLTIASMAAPGWVRINEVANTNMHATVLCGGDVTVRRSRNGKVYSWETNTDHIRIYIDMEGPTDLPFITYASSGAGWFDLEGFGQIALGSNKLLKDGKETMAPDEIEKAQFAQLGDGDKAAPN